MDYAIYKVTTLEVIDAFEAKKESLCNFDNLYKTCDIILHIILCEKLDNYGLRRVVLELHKRYLNDRNSM